MAKKTGLGRPPKPARLRRTRLLKLLLTPAEDRALRQYCTEHFASASEVARGCLKRFLEAAAARAGSGGPGKGGNAR